jgi:DNA-binding LacI/PurR family transcriptional regulator
MSTIYDVANKAGVSIATVSYVINKKRFVTEKLRLRVENAIDELNYVPNKMARSLRNGKTMTIGVIMHELTKEFAAVFLQGLENSASLKDYSIIISDLQNNPKNELKSINMLINQKVDGIIYSGFGVINEKLLKLYNKKTPIIIVDKPIKINNTPTILIDNKSSVYKALQHLTDLGHKHIYHIAGFRENLNTIIRADAYKHYLIENNLPFSNDNILYGDYTVKNGYEVTKSLLEKKRKFTSLFCGCDLIAFGAMIACKEKRVSVPEDIAVVGFDDIPFAQFFEPSLTTINYPIYKMGSLAFTLLYNIISKNSYTIKNIKLHTKLIIRRSTDKNIKDEYLI